MAKDFKEKDYCGMTFQECLALAMSGDGGAQYELSLRFRIGKVPGNYCGNAHSIAKEWLLKSANQGYSQAEAEMGKRCEYSLGLKENDAQNKEAADWFARAALKGNACAQYRLGLMYEEGRGVERNCGHAEELFKKAAEQWDEDAAYRLGVISVEKEEYGTALKYLEIADKCGNVRAHLLLGLVYEHTNNYRAAAKHFRECAEIDKQYAVFCDDNAVDDIIQIKGYVQYCLGKIYQIGGIIGKNSDKAHYWFIKAANNGNAKAQYELGCMLWDGDGVEKNRLSAWNYFEISAKNKYPWAQFELGLHYYFGEEVEQNYSKAAEKMKKAVKGGILIANVYLAVMYVCGLSVTQNYKEAAKLFYRYETQEEAFRFIHSGFNNGEPHNAEGYAMLCMGCLLRDGLDDRIEADEEEAFKWFYKAVESGYEPAYAVLAEQYFSDKTKTELKKWVKEVINLNYDPIATTKTVEAILDSGDDELKQWLGQLIEDNYAPVQYAVAEKFYFYAILVDEVSASNDNELKQFSQLLGKRYVDFIKVQKAECDAAQLKEIALHLYISAAKSGYIPAQVDLGRKYFSESLESQIPYQVREGEAVKIFLKAAQSGNAEACEELGDIYYGRKDYKAAAQWYLKAAKNGNKRAQYLLAEMYHKGLGLTQNYAAAIMWYESSAEPYIESETISTLSEGKIKIGEMYLKGEGVEKSTSKAVEYFKFAHSECGMSEDALFRLGEIYHNGYGIERNDSIALYYYKKATMMDSPESGIVNSPESVYRLGLYYLSLVAECDENDEKRIWYKKAKEYLGTAKRYGRNCDWPLYKIRNNLFGTKGSTRKLGENNKGLKPTEAFTNITKSLESEFGNIWDLLTKETQKMLKSGLYSYAMLYSLGEEVYRSIDFSSSITPITKALEIELWRVFYKGYLKFLKKNVAPIDINNSTGLVDRYGESPYITHLYKDENRTEDFTLGSLPYIVEYSYDGAQKRNTDKNSNRPGILIENHRYSISPHIQEYADSIFKEDAFDSLDRKNEITEYLICFTQDINEEIKNRRNDSAHKKAMSCSDAETCLDYLVLGKKLIFNLINKIKPEFYSDL